MIEAVKSSEAAAGMAEKQLKQMVMPFAKFKMEEAAVGGGQVRGLASRAVVLSLSCLNRGGTRGAGT